MALLINKVDYIYKTMEDAMKDLIQKSRVFYYFSKIAEIPRKTGNEAGMAEYLTGFAKEHGLESFRDEYNNVVIIKAASPGYENKDAVILQGHSDMVCVKEEGVDFDFSKDGIQLVVEGDLLKAKGTTLGADNGIAVALILAILEDKNMQHPRIEALITSGEEVGLVGANHIESKYFTATRLINIDSEEEGVFTASCAGGLRQGLTKAVTKVANPYSKSYELEISGLLGGHSGMEIFRQRANAIKVSARLLDSLGRDFTITSFKAGIVDNAIPNASVCVFNTDKDVKELDKLIAEIKEEYAVSDKGMVITIKEATKADKSLSQDDSRSLVDIILALPDGVRRYSDDIEGLVESSSNVAIVRVEEDYFNVAVSHRSSIESRNDEILAITDAIGRLAGCKVEAASRYPGWKYQADSNLRETLLSVYKKMYGKDAKVAAIHAGLECGVLKRQIGDLDMISMGCDMWDVHSPKERLSISSALRMTDYMVELLKAL